MAKAAIDRWTTQISLAHEYREYQRGKKQQELESKLR